jgi:hypothetical protein
MLSSAACSSLRSPATWLFGHLRRCAEIGTGHVLYAATGWLLDNVLYVWTVCELGLLKGGLLMGILATLYCAGILIVYQKMGLDWVGAGSINQLAPPEGAAWWQKTIRWAGDRGGWATFTVLSVFQDAFITTAFYRKGHFGPLKPKDWQVFLCSAVVSNTYWTLRSGAVGAVIINVWRGLSS